MFAQSSVSGQAHKGKRPARVAGVAPGAAFARMEKIMPKKKSEPAAGNVGTTPCILEPRAHLWDLGGTLTATFADKSDPSEPVGFIDSNQVLVVTVTVTLTGRTSRTTLCDTTPCACASRSRPADQAQPGTSAGGTTPRVAYSPCNTDT